MSKTENELLARAEPSFKVKKGEVLLKSGDTVTSGFYVMSGCLRSYVVDSKGKEHTYQFAPEGWLISDLEVFKNKQKAFLTIEAIEDSEVKRLLFDFDANNPDFAKLAMGKMQNRLYALQHRIIQLLSYTAEERYLEFIKTYPDLFSRVPLKMIASYLGITPEGLSRIRKEMVKGK